MPLSAPAAMPTFAVGHFFHQLRILPGSVVATFKPWRVRGCLPGVLQDWRLRQEQMPSRHS